MDTETIYMTLSAIIVVTSVLQRKTSFYALLKGLTVYRIASLFLFIGGAFEFSQLIQWDASIFLVTVAGVHLISLVSVLAVVLIAGYDDIIKGALFGGTFAAAHELIWTAFFLMAGAPFEGSVPPTVVALYYTVFVVLLLCIVLAFVAFFGVRSLKIFAKVAAVMLVFDAIWLGFGFKATISLLGHTAYYLNPTVNIVECLGWAIPAVWLVAEYLIAKRRALHIDVL